MSGGATRRPGAPKGAARETKGATRKLHRESLLRVPIIARAMGDARMRPVARAVDARWRYLGYLANVSFGFRPFAGELFYAARSSFAGWRAHAEGSAREFNMADRLVTEALSYAHDYLHAWTYGLLRRLRPRAELGYGKITERTFEDLVFLHIVAKTAATVGLDYWYLSTLSLNSICPIGTRMGPLSVTYHEDNIDEFRRARPGLKVQSKSFFIEKALFYCSGVFRGFNTTDLVQSPMIEAWLAKELRYATRLRKYTRQWLGFLRGEPVPDADAARPVDADALWKHKVIQDVGARLWALVKDGADSELHTIAPEQAWKSPRGAVDPRFVNACSLDGDDDEWLGRCADLSIESRRLAMEQALLRCDYDRFDRAKVPAMREAFRTNDVVGLQKLLSTEARVPCDSDEPRDLFVVP